LRNPAVNSSAFALIALVYGRAPRRRVPRQCSTSFRNASISLSMSTSLPRKVSQFALYVRTGPGEALRRMAVPAPSVVPAGEIHVSTPPRCETLRVLCPFPSPCQRRPRYSPATSGRGRANSYHSSLHLGQPQCWHWLENGLSSPHLRKKGRPQRGQGVPLMWMHETANASIQRMARTKSGMPESGSRDNAYPRPRTAGREAMMRRNVRLRRR
jgi:hypothetical protein